MDLAEVIDVKGWKALGNKCPYQNILSAAEAAPQKEEEEVDDENEQEETGKTAVDLEALKSNIKHEVEEEDNQLGLFGGKSKDEED